MSLLSICVPTYNRTKELKNINDNFFTKILDNYFEIIEIIVCDNSPLDVSNNNASILDKRVKYFWNKDNIKFAGNFIRCIEESKSEFLWIISDDDEVYTNNFIVFLEKLKNSQHENIDCFMIPYTTIYPFGDKILSNTKNDWKCNSISSAKVLWNSEMVPFILFSTGIIKKNEIKLNNVKSRFIQNAYIQVVAYLSMLNEESTIEFFDLPLIDYQPGYIGQTISVKEMSQSLYEVRKYLSEEFLTRPVFKEDYKGWLLWLFHHRGGYYYLHNGDNDRFYITRFLYKFYSNKALVLTILIFLPKFIVRPIYLIYKSYTDSKIFGKNNFSEFKNRFFCYKYFISNLDKEINIKIKK